MDCDALIVGGGPAGSTCAWKLRQAGLDVIVMDKQAFPRDKTCAGWVTPVVVQELQLDVAEYARGRIFQAITGFRTGAIGGKTTEVRYNRPASFGIRRCEFDHYLLQRCGARLRLGERIERLERHNGGWIVNGEIRAPLLIGAGGHFCPVARHVGAAAGKETVVAAQEVEFQLTPQQQADCRVQADTPELYFCPDLAGYAWCFRKGDFLNVGLGREDNEKISAHRASFCQWMQELGRIPRDLPEQFHGHAYILYGHSPRPLLDDGVLLIGDSAGLAYPQSGEGIRPAVESALMAAEVILQARPDYARDRLQLYARRILERFGERQPGGGVSGLLPEKLKHFLAARLLASAWFARHIVLDRWFLHAQQAPLAPAPPTSAPPAVVTQV